MPLRDLSRFRNELVDITEQITRLAEHRAPILEANHHIRPRHRPGAACTQPKRTHGLRDGLRYRLEPPVTWPEA